MRPNWGKLWAKLAREFEFRTAGPLGPRVAVFLQSFSVMFKNGVPVGAIMEILSTQEPHARLAHTLEMVYDGVIKRGWKLSDAMKSFPDVFPGEVVLLVRTGEETGDLAAQMHRAGKLVERGEALKSKVKQALSSPMMTAGASLAMMLFVVKYVMPKFIELYAGMGLQLPLITRTVIAVVAVINHPVFLLVLLGLGIFLYLRRRALAEWGFGVAVQMPILSGMIGSMMAAQFCESISVMYRDGVPITRVLEMMVRSAPFAVHRRHLQDVMVTLETTGDFAAAVRRVPYFPHVVASMSQVAEESGDVDHILKATADFMEQQNEVVLTQLVTILEPAVISVMGVVMCFFFVGMFLPVYSMLSKL
ncbi:MAG: type II secretion system F family protein [Candidatus Eremiobacterota bacterium]